LGVVNLESDALDAFDSEDVELVESLADTVALALDTAHLYSQAHQNAVNLSALYVVTRVASQSLVLDEVLSQVLSSALALLGFEAGLVGLTDPDDGRLRLAAGQGLPPSLAERLGGDALEETLCRRVCARQEGLVVGTLEPEVASDVQGGSPEAGQWFVQGLAAGGFRTFAGTPLLHGGQSLGALTLFSRRPRTSLTEDLGLLTSIGHQVATAVTNAQLFEEIARERSRLRALIEASRDGIALVGTDLRVLIINAPALALVGLPGEPDEWLNRPVREMLAALEPHAPDVAAWARGEIQRVQQGDERPAEGEYEVAGRTLHWLNLPVQAGKQIQGWLLVLRDVTEERSLERMREDLTHTMVHDLRNPLGGIFTSLLLVEKEDQANLAENQRFLLKIARNNAQRMLKIVDDILAVSKLESGRMELQRGPVQLGDLVAGVLRAQAPLAADKGLRLESEAPPTLPPAWADAWLIERVLHNLVDNAIKFTPPDGTVRILARQGEVGLLHVSVADSGPGIPADLQQRVFEKFVTGGQEGSGSGLGLAYCKLVVEAHGGRLGVESAPGQGATFTFSLPVLGDD
jgi:PAS domain S-box-containing protein